MLPAMRESGKGSIINVATMSIRNNKPMFGAYAAAKSAMTSMTRTMAKEVGQMVSVSTPYALGLSLVILFSGIYKALLIRMAPLIKRNMTTSLMKLRCVHP